MKKGWKILLISCGICAGIGVVLSVAGTVLGGVRDLQEYGRRGMQYLENDHWWSQKYSEPEEMDEELDYIDEEVSPEITEDLEGISELDIELSYVELIMERSDSNLFRPQIRLRIFYTIFRFTEMKILWRFVPRIPGFGRISEKTTQES